MNTTFQKGMCLTVLAVALFAVPALAQTITVYSNLGPGGTYNDNSSTAYDWDGLNPGLPIVPFTPSSTVNMTDAMLALNFLDYSTGVLLGLASDSNGVPGSLLATAWGRVNGGLTPFNFTTSPLIEAGTQYWIWGRFFDPDSAVEWYISNSDVGTTASCLPPPGDLFPQGDFSDCSLNVEQPIPAFQVDGTRPVPEPSPMLLLSIGLIWLIGFAGMKPKLKSFKLS